MSIFRDFEKKLEGLFEGVFLRAFKSGVQPVELGKKLVRELEGNKVIGVDRIYVPNRYEVGLSSRDYSRFESYQAVMATELENLLISYIKQKGYVVVDRPRVWLKEVGRFREGEFSILARIEGEIPAEKEGGPGEAGIIEPVEARGPAVLELMDSEGPAARFALQGEAVQIGRTGDNDVVLPDPNVSRVHARIVRRGDSYLISDIQSTNGTWINEERISQAELQDNDVIRLGSTRLLFRRSSD